MRLRLLTKRPGLLTLTAVSCLATTVACGGGGAPVLSGLSDQVAQVGTELKIDLNGSDPEGDKLTYNFRAADLMDLDGHAEVTVSPSGAGVFRWTPLAADVGQHAFDFVVSDGSNDTTVTITIDVKSAIGSATAPIFRQPLGSGTTVDMTHSDCVDVDVVIEDADSPGVTIAQEQPLIEGAMLTTKDGLTATWHWCPTKAQQAADNRYTLVLSADDGDNPKTIKNYLIVLRGGGGTSCPGAAPVITHTPMNQSTILDLTIDATVTDDKGLKDTPLFYYSTTNPGTTPDLATMTQLSTLQLSGTSTNGDYAADVPNPVATMPAGQSVTLYYVFVADDDDDPMGTCDHSTTSQVYSMKVTSTGVGNLPACATCTHDAQCGTGNECVYMGSMGASYCLQSCGASCATGFTCSANAVSSVDGASHFACVPQSGSCVMPTGACVDDTWEVNDSRSDASANPTLTPDLYSLVSCPSTTSTTRANDDWFKVVLTGDTRLDLQLEGGPETDLDLHLYHADGTVVSESTSLSASEAINKCLKGATYYVKVNGYGHARNEYLLSYGTTAETCNTTCVDDASEDDDTFSQARPTTFPTFTSTGNKICPADDDWYHVQMFTGDNVTLDLTFTQSDSTQDLDLHLYKDSVDQWPCSPADPSTCSAAHGQGASSNEHAVFTAPAGCESGCDYYVVVRGYNNSSNSYGLAIAIQ